MQNALFPDLVLKTATFTITEVTEAESFSVLQLKYYPNPVSDILHLNYQQNILIPKLSIYSIEGKELMSFKNVSLPYDIDMTNFQPGIYSLRLINSDSFSQFSIIKE